MRPVHHRVSRSTVRGLGRGASWLAVLVVAATGCPAGNGAADEETPRKAPAPAEAGPPIGAAPWKPAKTEDSLERLVADARRDGRNGRVADVTPEELAAFEAAFADLVRSRTAPELPEATGQALARLGFEVARTAPPGPPGWVVVREAAGIRRGGGIYLIRTDEDAPRVIVQAPHTFFDSGTGVIVRRVLESGRAGLGFFNTVHRYEGGRRRDEGGADVAHAEATFFQAATRGAAAAIPEASFLQVHGFAASKHAGLEGSLILSAGSRAGSEDARFHKLAAALRERFASRARVYGQDVQELGGTTNVQGRFINAYSDDAFYHLEMADDLRKRFLEVEATQRALEDALKTLGEREAP